MNRNGFRLRAVRFRMLPVLLLSLAGVIAAQANGEFRGLEERLVSLYEEKRSAMVRVKAVYPSQEDAEEDIPQVVIGSGFFISREGLIITNASIVNEPLRVWVEHKQIAYSAEVIGIDQRSNIAFLRTHSLPEDFSFFHLVDGSDLPPLASFVLRLSMPLEFEASPNFGMVAGYESRFGERFFPCMYIRTTIPAGPGDGGSAYIDLTGRLIGIQVGSLPDVGSSYVLPARAALRIRDDILFSGEVTYGWIGFEIELVSSIQNGRQVVLSDVFPDSPAKSAGLMEGDILEQIGDYPVRSLDDLRNAMFYTRVGQYVDVRVMRNNEVRRISVKVDPRPEDEPMQVVEPLGADSRESGNPLKQTNVKSGPDDAGPMPFEGDYQRPGGQTNPPEDPEPDN